LQDEENYEKVARDDQNTTRIVLPGDYIGRELISGHGTYEADDRQIFASMAGVVH
jgi:exosome complex component RRP4